jgi:hypothetical protein
MDTGVEVTVTLPPEFVARCVEDGVDPTGMLLVVASMMGRERTLSPDLPVANSEGTVDKVLTSLIQGAAGHVDLPQADYVELTIERDRVYVHTNLGLAVEDRRAILQATSESPDSSTS